MTISIEARTWTIYALFDPRSPASIRYVGNTHGTVRSRLQQHVSGALRGSRYHSAKWVRALLREGAYPEARVLCSGSGSGWEAAEVFWIRKCREDGHNLTNHAEGGRGPVGCVRSAETRAKLAAVNRGKKQSPELVEKRVAPLRGRPIPPETLERIKAGMVGRKVSEQGRASIAQARRANPEWNLKISTTNKVTYARRKASGLVAVPVGRTPSEQTRAKLRESHLGKVQSAATRAKRSAAMKQVWAERKTHVTGVSEK